MTSRRRFKQTESLEKRLVDEAIRLREQAKMLGPGAVRDALLRKARQTETASHIKRVAELARPASAKISLRTALGHGERDDASGQDKKTHGDHR